jgi:hypothetical protein
MALVSEKTRVDNAVAYCLSRRFGVEREAFVSDLRGNPLNVPKLLSQASFRFDGFETITREVAPNQVEMVTNPFREVDDLLSSLLRLEEMVLGLNDGDIRLQYLPRSKKPIGKLMDDVFATPRHKAILDALSHPDEGGEEWTHVYEMARVCATHFHLDFRHESPQKKVNACNLLNIVAPDILAWARDEFGLPPGERSRAWARFACLERLPAPRWFRDFADYKQRFESLPRLAVGDEKEGGVWRVDMVAKQAYGDPAAEGSTWWGVRLRDKYGSIEFRYLPTMPKAEQVTACAVAIDEWLERALERVGEQVFPTFESALAVGTLLPFKGRAVSRNEVEWWQRMNQF